MSTWVVGGRLGGVGECERFCLQCHQPQHLKKKVSWKGLNLHLSICFHAAWVLLCFNATVPCYLFFQNWGGKVVAFTETLWALSLFTLYLSSHVDHVWLTGFWVQLPTTFFCSFFIVYWFFTYFFLYFCSFVLFMSFSMRFSHGNFESFFPPWEARAVIDCLRTVLSIFHLYVLLCFESNVTYLNFCDLIRIVLHAMIICHVSRCHYMRAFKIFLMF